MTDTLNDDLPNLRLYGVSTGNGNDGISHMYPDYYVWTNEPFKLCEIAALAQFKEGAGRAWAKKHVDIDGEAEHTIQPVSTLRHARLLPTGNIRNCGSVARAATL